MVPESIFVVEAATTEYALENNWLDVEETKAEETELTKMALLKDTVGDGFTGSQNKLAEAVSALWEKELPRARGVKRSAAIALIKECLEDGVLHLEGETYTVQ